MSSILLMILIAGFVFAAFLLLAVLAWGIRAKRSEGNFIPAPEGMKKPKREISNPLAGAETASGWIREREHAAPDSIAESERIPIGAEPESPVKDFLRSAVPQFSTIVDLGKLVQQIQAAGEKLDSSEERKAVMRKAVEELLEQQPENEFLRQVLDSLQPEGYASEESEPPERIKVIQIPGRNLIRVDGVEYYSVSDIPDPDMREQVRRMLASLNQNNSS